ncbi:cGMP-dependent protein kinase egl-4-like isoform X1 [Ptychodera flava]|uniref:cGMP-dependent protein kinase egl-4-like isoform X1 n=1 Tax=Ptychodera flava TaxID=63121 RepID=UPI003969EC51
MPGVLRRSLTQDEFYQPQIDDKVFDEYVRPENYQGSLDAILLVAKLQAQEEAKEKQNAQVRVPVARERKVDFQLSQPRQDSSNSEDSGEEDLGEDKRARLTRLGLDPNLEFPFPAAVGVSQQEKRRLKKRTNDVKRRSNRLRELLLRGRETPEVVGGNSDEEENAQRPSSRLSTNGSQRTRKVGVSSVSSRRSAGVSEQNKHNDLQNSRRRGALPFGKPMKRSMSALRRWKSDSDICTLTSDLNSYLSYHEKKGSILRHSWDKINEMSKIKETKKVHLDMTSVETKEIKSFAKQRRYDAVRRHSAPRVGRGGGGDEGHIANIHDIESSNNMDSVAENDDKLRNENISRELMKRRSSSGPATGRRSSISDDAPRSSGRRSTVGYVSHVRFLPSESSTPSDMSASPPGSKRTSLSSGRFSISRRGRPATASEVNRQLRKAIARERFQHAIKLVITLVRVFNMIQSRTEKEAQSRDYMTFTEIAEQFQSEDMKNSGLSFNPKDFKANREINISIEVKNILSMPSDQRTPEQLQTALYGLQTMKSFAEYPLHMQEKLTRVAWLEHIPPKKIIIRQGHYAEAFYFVISGSAVVTIMETNPNTGETKMRTATVLRKGSSFGELALLHHSVRTATVSSQGQVQLLAIGREDFLTSSCGVNDRAKSRNTSHSSGKSTA